jgi:hypothetical protein
MSVLQMLFFNHLGEKEDELSLARWIVDLGRDKRQLWEKGRLPKVKDFRGCLDLVDTVLDGYIIAFIAEFCHFGNVKELLIGLEHIPPETMARALEELNTIIGDHSLVTRMRQKQPTERDMQYEDLLLFIQTGLILRSFGKAMRIGDSGMVIECLSYFTIWYQGSGQTRYAAETIHWMACIKKLWSPQMKQFWMENAMVNPSGKKEGWMSCDYLGEFIVGQVKKAMHQNSNAPNEKFVFDDVSPLTLHFLNLRRQMMQECDVPYSTSHSTKVETHFDVEQIASYVLKEGFIKFVPGRMGGAKASADLYANGLEQLASYVSIGKYIQKAMKDNGKSGMAPGSEELESEEPEAGEGLHEGGPSHEELESLDEIDLEGFMEEDDVDDDEILFN